MYSENRHNPPKRPLLSPFSPCDSINKHLFACALALKLRTYPNQHKRGRCTLLAAENWPSSRVPPLRAAHSTKAPSRRRTRHPPLSPLPTPSSSRSSVPPWATRTLPTGWRITSTRPPGVAPAPGRQTAHPARRHSPLRAGSKLRRYQARVSKHAKLRTHARTCRSLRTNLARTAACSTPTQRTWCWMCRRGRHERPSTQQHDARDRTM